MAQPVDKNKPAKEDRFERLLPILAFSASVAAHAAVIGILNSIDLMPDLTGQATKVEMELDQKAHELALKAEKEKLVSDFKVLLHQAVQADLEKLARGEEIRSEDYVRLDVIESKIQYAQLDPESFRGKDLKAMIEGDINAVVQLLDQRIDELAEDPELQWSGVLKADFPTVQKALYTYKNRIFLNEGDAESIYQRDAWNFSQEVMEGWVNCQSSRMTALVLRAIYRKKGFSETDLAHLGTITWKDHIASAYLGQEKTVQLQELNLEDPLHDGIWSKFTGAPGVVGDLRVHMALYLQEQKDIAVTDRMAASVFLPFRLENFLDEPISDEALPLNKNPIFGRPVSDEALSLNKNPVFGQPAFDEPYSLLGPFEGLLEELYYVEDEMRSAVLKVDMHHSLGLSLWDGPAWLQNPEVSEIMFGAFAEDLTRLLDSRSSVDYRNMCGLYEAFSVYFSGPDSSKLTQLLDEKVREAENPISGLFNKTQSLTFLGMSSMDEALWDRISKRDGFEEQWTALAFETGVLFPNSLYHYRYLSQYFNTKGFHFDIQAMEASPGYQSENPVFFTTPFDLEQMDDLNKLKVLESELSPAEERRLRAAELMKDRNAVYSFVKRSFTKDLARRNFGDLHFLARLSQQEIDSSSGSQIEQAQRRYSSLWSNAMEAMAAMGKQVPSSFRADIPFLRPVLEKSHLEYLRRSYAEETEWPSMMKNLYLGETDPSEFSLRDFDELDEYFQFQKKDEALDKLPYNKLAYNELPHSIGPSAKNALKKLYQKLDPVKRRRLLEISAYFSFPFFDSETLYPEDLAWLQNTKITFTSLHEVILLKILYAPQFVTVSECALAKGLSSITRNYFLSIRLEHAADDLNLSNSTKDPVWLKEVLRGGLLGE